MRSRLSAHESKHPKISRKNGGGRKRRSKKKKKEKRFLQITSRTLHLPHCRAMGLERCDASDWQ